MKKISILALHLGTGGIEKTIATLSNILIKKYDVEIISNYQVQEKPAFYIDSRVKITYLMPNLKPNARELKVAIKNFKIIDIIKEGMKSINILYLRKKLMVNAIKNLNCDIAISTRDIHNKWLGKYAPKTVIKIAQEHNNGDLKYRRKIIKTIKNIDYFMPVSKQLKELYEKELNGNKSKCIYIPHCLKDYTDEVSDLRKGNIISVGRLEKDKGFFDLIDVFELLVKKNQNVHLYIAGDGEEREGLETYINNKNLQDKITLLGFLNEEEIKKYYLQSSIYVMTSICESFGLVLIEAESFGIPLISFKGIRRTR